MRDKLTANVHGRKMVLRAPNPMLDDLSVLDMVTRIQEETL